MNIKLGFIYHLNYIFFITYSQVILGESWKYLPPHLEGNKPSKKNPAESFYMQHGDLQKL